jgi:transketolase C-terminal domain/subunit
MFVVNTVNKAFFHSSRTYEKLDEALNYASTAVHTSAESARIFAVDTGREHRDVDGAATQDGRLVMTISKSAQEQSLEKAKADLLSAFFETEHAFSVDAAKSDAPAG